MNTIKDNFYRLKTDIEEEDFTMVVASDGVLYFIEIGQPIRKFVEVEETLLTNQQLLVE